jgi:hypothetical protein
MQNKNYFSSKATDNKIRLKVNPLYFTLERLKENKSSLLADIKLDHINDPGKSVTYVKFKADPVHRIYHQEFQFSERHLTIHEFYDEKNKDLKNGLSITHYTEIYRSIDKQNVIHVYFNKRNCSP